MSDLQRVDQPRPAADVAPASPVSHKRAALQRRAGLLLWAVVFAVVLFVQWPMLKGMYYKATGAKAPASAVAWRTAFDAALAESAQTGKPVLVDFTASWCPPCQVMKHEVWPDADVAGTANSRFVPLLMDVDDPHGAQIAQKYGIRDIPTILVLDANGQVLRVGSFMSAGDMLEFLESDA